MRALVIVVAISTLLLEGCKTYLKTYDDRPLPVVTVPTRGGQVLEADDGELYLRPASLDMAAAMGVRLAETQEGVIVTACLRADSCLLPGDRILEIGASLPMPTGTWTASRYGVIEIDAKPGWGTWRVTHVSDLQGYMAGIGWVELDLMVLRNGHSVALHLPPLRLERRPFPVQHATTEVARRWGLELSTVAEWPERNLPRGVSRNATIITRVAEDSPAALAGIRPLDVIPGEARLSDLVYKGMIQDTRGTRRIVTVEDRRPPSEYWLPSVLSLDNDHRTRFHFGIGLLDLVFHWSRKRTYDSITDSYRETTLCGTLLVTYTSEESRSGAQTSWELIGGMPSAKYLDDLSHDGE